jgi:inorganic triphosphatase YgiF
MASEVELKLALPAALAAKVPHLSWVRKSRCGPAGLEQLYTVYFDTPKLKLREHGLTIRVRHSGKRRLQTIKALQASANGPFGRGEWKQEISADRPVLELAKGTPLERLVTKQLRRKLRPIFETVVERKRVPIHSGGADLELAVDRGQIKRYGRPESEPISEVEIEVKQGDRRELPRVAGRLARSLPVAYDPVPNAERGYALSRRESQRPIRAHPIVLDARMSTANAFTLIGLSCLDHAFSNERAVRAGDPEGVHQMRVGLRRLRAALSIFKGLLRGAEPNTVKGELRWLTEQLSPARDVDVLLEERVKHLRGHTPVAVEASVLSRALGAERDAGLARARTALQSECYRKLGLKTAMWLIDGAWTRSRSADVAARRKQSAKSFAVEVLHRRSRKLVKKGRNIEELDATQRHKLRIASKKLRYAAEFFASLVSKKRRARRKRFERIVKRFQGVLGKLNDIEVHKKFATRIARPRRPSSMQSHQALAMGYITGQEQMQVASCMAILDEITGKPLPEFWR